MKVALFGGAFDPPHIGHVIGISAILNSGLVDQVWVVPSGSRTDKSYHVSDEHRREMVTKMIDTEFSQVEPVALCWTEFDAKGKIVGTIELLDALKIEHPDLQFLVAIGQDLAGDLAKWKHPQRVKDEVKFLTYSRLGKNSFDEVSDYHIEHLPTAVGLEISSTSLRELIAERKFVSGMMPAEVKSYIEAEGLYR